MIISKIRQYLGFETDEERFTRYEDIKKSFEDTNLQLDELAKDFYIEKSLFESRMSVPENFPIQGRIKEKFDLYLEDHKDRIRKAKKQYDSLKRDKDSLEKALSDKIKEIEEKNTPYSRIKKSYQSGQISLDSFNTIIKGITKEDKTKYADFIVLNENNELLLLKRSSWEDSNAGAWVLPGGHVDPGEEFEVAAKRELMEEAGLTVDSYENVGSYEDDKCHIEYYQTTINSKEKEPVLDWEEARDYKWVPWNEIKEEPMVFNMSKNVMQILGLVNKHKEIIRKAVLMGLISPEQLVRKSVKTDLESLYDELGTELQRMVDRRNSVIVKSMTDNFVVEQLDNEIEKAVKDISKLSKIKKLIYREGKLIFATYYVKTGETIEDEEKIAPSGLIKEDIVLGEELEVGQKNKSYLLKGVVSGFSFCEKDNSYYVNLYDQNTDKSTWVNLSKADYFVKTSDTPSVKKEEPKEEFTFVKELGGSTGAKLVVDIYGNKYVKKTGKDLEHIKAEYQALLLYKALGVEVPAVHKFDEQKGELYTEYIEGAETLKEFLANHGSYSNEFVKSQLSKGLGADILLANWDVVGLDYDNILVTNEPLPIRVDVGGSLDKRAQGANKPFTKDVPEIDTFLDSNINPQTYNIFGKVDMVAALEELVDKYESEKGVINGLKGVSPEIKSILAERIETIKEKLQHTSPKYKLSSINYDGDIFEIGVDEDGESFYDDNIVQFYTKLNKELKITEKDIKTLELQNSYFNESNAEKYFKQTKTVDGSMYLSETNVAKEALKRGVSYRELFVVREYTSGSGSFNDLAKAYTDSVTGNVNFDIDHLISSQDMQTKTVKKKVGVDLLGHYNNMLNAIKSVNHSIDTNGNHLSANKTKLAEADSSYKEIFNLIDKEKNKEISLSKHDIESLHYLRKMYDSLAISKITDKKTPPITDKPKSHTISIETEETVSQKVTPPGKTAITVNGFAGKSEYYVARLKVLCTAIKKLEQIKKKCIYKEGVFNRGIEVYSSIQSDFMKQHKTPNQYLMSQWGSSSSWESKGFTGSKNTMLKIIGEGIHINDISHYQGHDESEVLHKPFTLYKNVSYNESDSTEGNKRVVTIKKVL